MTNKITRQDFHRHDTANHMIIRTRFPHAQIDDRGLPILPLLRGSGLSAGDHILVQCLAAISADKISGEELMAEADFVVTSVKIQQRMVTDDNGGERMAQETTFGLARRSEWWSPPGAGAAAGAVPPQQPAAPTPPTTQTSGGGKKAA